MSATEHSRRWPLPSTDPGSMAGILDLSVAAPLLAVGGLSKAGGGQPVSIMHATEGLPDHGWLLVQLQVSRDLWSESSTHQHSVSSSRTSANLLMVCWPPS